MADHATIWDNCLGTIKSSIDSQSYQTWFEPIQPVALKDRSLTIQVPHRLFYEWLEEHYLDLLKRSVRQHLGDGGQLLYQILPTTMKRPRLAPAYPTASPQGQPAPTNGSARRQDSSLNPFVIPGITKPKIESNLNAQYTFNNFIEGNCNQLARNAGLAIADRPGTTSFNPLVIYGQTGLGKTHLAQAIGNEVTARYPEKSVVYTTTDQFTNDIINSIKENAISGLINDYKHVDVLIVDDIHALRDKKRTQEIFFNLFNSLRQQNKQIILTTDKPVKELDIEERLKSRFKWGLVADLQMPDLETRMAILAHKSDFEGIEIPNDVSEFICFNVKNNIRELEGALNTLVLRSSFTKGEIDLDLAKEVIRNFVSELNQEVTVDSIQKLVADYYNLDVEKLAGQTRRRQVVIARQLSMYLAKTLTDKSLKAIGQNFGGRDHSTVIYSVKTVRNMIETDQSIKKAVDELERQIKMSVNE
ncbi:MAG: chromosomal replication initiator protein DnaA [Saprospiraceae bacterium]